MRDPSTNVTPLQADGPVQRVHSARYLDESFAQREVEQVFKRAWLVAGAAHSVPRTGDYFVFERLGESIVVVRDERGTVRAFHNTCRHRGSKLCEGHGRVDAIACPYHGWTYGLDGKLNHVPREEGFGGSLHRGRSGLSEVHCDTAFGFVWVNLGSKPPPLRETLGGLDAELEPYLLEEMRPIAIHDEVVPANWKAMLENAMDFYHVPFVHGRTINKHVDKGPDLSSYGDHTRQRLMIAPYGWRGRLDRRCTRGGPYSEEQVSSLHKYMVFPNFLINVLPYHLTVMQAWPGPEVGTSTLRYAFCKRRGARGLELARVYATWLASRYILKEDREILDRFQSGITTRRTPVQILHEEESAASHFHGVLNRWMK